MSEGKIEVNTDGLSVGGDSCGYAAGAARRAADRLNEAKLASGIFGDFAEAHSFHSALSAAHQTHKEQLQAHHSKLTGLSGKADIAAKSFTDTDESSAGRIDSAAAGIE